MSEGAGHHHLCSGSLTLLQAFNRNVLQVEAVVRRVMWLTSQDQTAKVLVFSTWQDVLDLVGHALSTNQHRFAHPRGPAGFKSAIASFRRCACNTFIKCAGSIVSLLLHRVPRSEGWPTKPPLS